MGLCQVLEIIPLLPYIPFWFWFILVVTFLLRKMFFPFCIHPNCLFIAGTVLGKDLRPLDFINQRSITDFDATELY